MKRFIILLLTLCTLLTACAEVGKPPDALTDPPTDELVKETYGCEAHYRIAMIADFGVFDGDNVECYQGIERFVQENDGSDLMYYSPTEDSTDARIACIEQAVEEGAQIIVLPKYTFALALIKMQEKYPEIYFLGIDITQGDMTEDYVEYYEPTPNAACVSFATEEVGWLAGYAAVKEGYRKLGFASTLFIPQTANYAYGFMIGADTAAQELGVNIEIRHGYDQHPSCGERDFDMIRAWCESGTELLFTAGMGEVEHIAEEYGCMTISSDVRSVTPYDNRLASAVNELDNAVYLLLSSIYDGTWDTYGGKFTELSLADGDFLSLASQSFENFTAEDYDLILSELKDGTRPLPDITDFMEIPALSEHTQLLEG